MITSKNKYFEEDFELYVKKIKELSNYDLKLFSSFEFLNKFLELQDLISYKFSDYVYDTNYGNLVILKDYIRQSDENIKLYIGEILNYKW